MNNELKRKVFVSVNARFDPEGKITPLSITWEDGTIYEIDKVIDIRRAPSLKAGGIGMRYTVRIQGKKSHIWFDDTRWFVEGK